ncbi:hypothetical protein [Thalassomonas actiniarum]|uniref:Transposase n=1 Tax=Thalassomonas actiniarum TaxID=485447 RepID=A0AAE9YWI6_9GAMM|nr:hypothetical protein [Thalassomonas actiniarum]WDE00833.1 hypothetical protein SG35_009475 [Thalassomonas actiniarum]
MNRKINLYNQLFMVRNYFKENGLYCLFLIRYLLAIAAKFRFDSNFSECVSWLKSGVYQLIGFKDC